MALADTFQEIVDSLPDDWTDLEFDLRILDERRYVDASLMLVPVQPAALLQARLALARARRPPLRARRRRCPPCTTSLKLLDEAEIAGELAVREVRERPRRGRADVGAPRVGPARVQVAAGPVGGGGAMARVVALVPDLLFGSRVQGDLQCGRPRGRARGFAAMPCATRCAGPTHSSSI